MSVYSKFHFSLKYFFMSSICSNVLCILYLGGGIHTLEYDNRYAMKKAANLKLYT